MHIENDYRHKKIYKSNNNVYDLSACKWTTASRSSKKKKEISHPGRGFIHRAVSLKNSIYVLATPLDNRQQLAFYSYHPRSNQWKNWGDCNAPTARDSFGLTIYRNQIYLFGGSSFESQLSDLYAFNSFTCQWRQIQVREVGVRNPLVFSTFGEEGILLYGGVNVETGQIYEDAYFFIEDDWIQFKQIVNAPEGLSGAQVAHCGSRLFLFGGEVYRHGETHFNQSLYQILVNFLEVRLQFVEITVNTTKNPIGRVGHNMVGINQDYFIVLGGQNGQKMMRDIWLFEVEALAWCKVDPANGPIRPLSDNTLIMQNNTLLLFGGFIDSANMWNEQVLTIEFGEEQLYHSEICSQCIQKSTQKEKEDRLFPRPLVLSIGFFYTASLEIKHPFQAISMIYQCAAYLKATSFRFSTIKTLNEIQYLDARFNGLTLDRKQFQQLIFHSSPESDYSRYLLNLKMGSFRLGKTFIFITADDRQRKVVMFSADSKVSPAFDETYNYLAYIENIKKDCVESQEGKIRKALILNVLKSRLPNAKAVLSIQNENRLLIFEKNILVTSEKVYYYQLISYTNDDISIFKSTKKVQFLEEMGYQISKDLQMSLKTYISHFNISAQNGTRFFINAEEKPIEQANYITILKNMEAKRLIRPIDMVTKVLDCQFESSVYIAESQQVIENNFGLLLYLNGKLINRIDVNFGDLFKEQFYKTKFKKAVTVFQYLGVINIKKGLTVNYFTNGLKKTKSYYGFMEILREALKKGRQDRSERRVQKGDGEDEQEEKKTFKRVKT